MEDTLIIITVTLALSLLLVILYAHAITKEASFIEDEYHQAKNQLKRVNRELRNAEIELIHAYTEATAWKEQYLSMIRSDTDFSHL